MKEEKKLTKRQEDVLTFVKKYIAAHGYPPAIREICAGVGLSSPATVFVHIKNLENMGILRQTNNKFRTIELLVDNEYADKKDSVVKVPLLGEIFTLHVSGESMINKGILNNDYVIVKRTSNAKNGDVVVAMTDENEVTLKTFYKEKDHIRLQPENDTMAPFIFDNVTILGVAVGLYRKM